MNKKKLKEIIVVEGKSDIIAVKRAFKDCVDVVATHGLGITQEVLDELSELNDRRGLIILTDPDYAGKKISNIIKSHIPNVKFANIARENAMKKSDIGVENASDDDIISAINKARPEFKEVEEIFTIDDINDNNLSGGVNSKERRIKLCKELSIRYCNSKQLLIKLNSFGITREEIIEALKRIED